MKNSCLNRKPIADTVTVQLGYHPNGTRNLIEIPNLGSKSCMFDSKSKSSQCRQCLWAYAKDPRDEDLWSPPLIQVSEAPSHVVELIKDLSCRQAEMSQMDHLSHD